ncbi:MAG: hypothetical protein V1875_08990 [Candidatus Altiarchaeota archaeon]
MSFVDELRRAKRQEPGLPKQGATGEEILVVEPQAQKKSPMEGKFYTQETIRKISLDEGGASSNQSVYSRYASMKKKPE